MKVRFRTSYSPSLHIAYPATLFVAYRRLVRTVFFFSTSHLKTGESVWIFQNCTYNFVAHRSWKQASLLHILRQKTHLCYISRLGEKKKKKKEKRNKDLLQIARQNGLFCRTTHLWSFQFCCIPMEIVGWGKYCRRGSMNWFQIPRLDGTIRHRSSGSK